MSRRANRWTPPAAVNAADQLRALYDRVPAVECRGKCQHSCVAVDMADTEAAQVRVATGIRVPPRGEAPDPARCPVLTALGTCAAYQVRPMICRLWGASEVMPCPHGCRPAAGPLSAQESLLLLIDALEVGGTSGYSVPLWAELRRLARAPEIQPELVRLLRGDISAYTDLQAWIRTHPGG